MEQKNSERLSRLNTKLEVIKAKIEAFNYKAKIKDYGVIDNTCMMESLHLKIGARVMLTYNISVSDSLVNGMLGEVMEFIYFPTKDGQKSKIKAYPK